MILIGYSGHAFVVCGILNAAGRPVTGYCDVEEKAHNPFNLIYIGKDDADSSLIKLKEQGYFISIGSNLIRRKIQERLCASDVNPVNAIHPSAIIDPSVVIDPYGVMISAGVCINPLATIGTGVICNTGCIIEHECQVSEFAHIGPGAVLCGNVSVGINTFVGAGSVVRQGVRIGNNAMIGAGAVVVKDVMNNETVVGNPSRAVVYNKK
jgi:sugar O-acyltransferase (sialic acid O-acetyltransferase NeuD family)